MFLNIKNIYKIYYMKNVYKNLVVMLENKIIIKII